MCVISRNQRFQCIIWQQAIFLLASKKQTSGWKTYWNVKNDGHTTGNLLGSLYRQKYYKLIGIDLSRQINTSIPQQF